MKLNNIASILFCYCHYEVLSVMRFRRYVTLCIFRKFPFRKFALCPQGGILLLAPGDIVHPSRIQIPRGYPPRRMHLKHMVSHLLYSLPLSAPWPSQPLRVSLPSGHFCLPRSLIPPALSITLLTTNILCSLGKCNDRNSNFKPTRYIPKSKWVLQLPYCTVIIFGKFCYEKLSLPWKSWNKW